MAVGLCFLGMDVTSTATTVVLSRRVREGQDAAFRQWAEGFTEAMASFPGFLSGQNVPPVEDAQAEWTFVFSFDSPASLKAWLASEVRKSWLAKAEPMVESQGPAHVVSGLEHFFGLLPPDRAPAPPVWKVAVSVLVGLFPITLLNQLFLAPRLVSWPLPLRAFVTAAVLVVLMTWGVMPCVTRLLRGWLQAPASKGPPR